MSARVLGFVLAGLAVPAWAAAAPGDPPVSAAPAQPAPAQPAPAQPAPAQPAPAQPAPAQPATPPPSVPAPASPDATPPAPADGDALPTPEEVRDWLEDLEQRQRDLAREQRRDAATRERVDKLAGLSRFLTVFVDVGAFAVAGDGSGIRSDLGHLYFPKYADRIPAEWVFMGDSLSTAINSLGEPADGSDSRELPADTLGTRGHPSLIVNAVGLDIHKYFPQGIELVTLAELLPRPDHDLLDVELAHLDWWPSKQERDLVIQVGKIDPVLGIEYRVQDPRVRIGVTPSLIGRYLDGRPLGLAARWTVGNLRTAAAITNGDSFDRRFEREEVLKANALPTVSGHVQWILPVGNGLDVGASGAIGPQDNQPDGGVLQWHVGVDAWLRDLGRFDVMAEYVQGRQRGATTGMTPCDVAACLHYKGAYVLTDYRARPWIAPYARVDWRDAVHEKGVEFVYESHILRATLGARFALTSRILAKIEYTWNHELAGIPQFPDDVLTSSLVVATD